MEILWVCLAAMAVHYKQLDAAQVAFAALRETDKILYVDAIKVRTSLALFMLSPKLTSLSRVVKKNNKKFRRRWTTSPWSRRRRHCCRTDVWKPKQYSSRLACLLKPSCWTCSCSSLKSGPLFFSFLAKEKIIYILFFPTEIFFLFCFVNNCRALELAVKHDSNIDVVVAYRRKYLEQFGWTETIPRFIEYAKKVIRFKQFQIKNNSFSKYKCFQIRSTSTGTPSKRN